MSDVSQGPGWWQASDGKWYPPEQAPAAAPTGPPPGYAPPGYGAPTAPPYGGAPVGGTAPGQLAEWPIRVASYVIDAVAIGIVANFVALASSALGTILSLVGLAFAIYNAYLNGSTGQSVGKRIMGTKVVSEQTGQPIGGGAGVLRFFAHFVDAIICFVGFLFPLWDAKKQTIADKIMKTVVITGEPKKSFGEALQG